MISVLMCTYNRERLLKRAIDSVLNQTYRDLELIIVDDGSTDGTEALIKGYKDSRICYYKMARNSYYCYAANFGLSKCKGDYVAFMNSDDIWKEDKLEKQIQFMDVNPLYGACFSAVTLINDEEKNVSGECAEVYQLFAKQYDSQKDCLQFLLKHRNSLCHPSALVRKTILDQVGGFNLMFCQLADYELWIRIVTKAPVYVMKEELVKFRWDMKKNDQISAATLGNTIRGFNEQVLIRKQLVERLTDEQFVEFFGDKFKNETSTAHLELEFERAFLLAECMGDAPELKVLGIEKLEQVLRLPGAMETLREHFKMDIFDLYAWNKAHMYKTPWLENEFLALEQTIVHKDNVMEQMQQQIQIKNETIVKQEEVIDKQKNLIEEYENSTSWKVTKPMRDFMRRVKHKKQ